MTLIELLVTALIMIFILTAILNLLTASTRVGNSDLARNQALDDETAGFSRMVNEIRQAYQINCPTGGCTSNASTSAIDFDERVYESGAQADRRIAYNCSVPQPGVSGEYECVRYEAPASDTSDAVPLGPTSTCGGTCTTTVVVQRLVSSSVFTGLTTGTSGSGAVRWVSGTATITTPANGNLSSNLSVYQHDLILSQSFSIPQLIFGQ